MCSRRLEPSSNTIANVRFVIVFRCIATTIDIVETSRKIYNAFLPAGGAANNTVGPRVARTPGRRVLLLIFFVRGPADCRTPTGGEGRGIRLYEIVASFRRRSRTPRPYTMNVIYSPVTCARSLATVPSPSYVYRLKGGAIIMVVLFVGHNTPLVARRIMQRTAARPGTVNTGWGAGGDGTLRGQ